MELWTSTSAAPRRAANFARRAEAVGWDGMLIVDSQNMTGDPYVCLALSATTTDRLGLQTSVTNPVTRHAAVAASSALTVQRLSGGRFVLGIGRGDSALAHLGRAPARLRWFEGYLESLQAYLSGSEVSFDRVGIPDDVAPPLDTLGLAGGPTGSSIAWAGSVPKVPVEVAATGERVISIAARHSDRIMFALGADTARLAWGVRVAHEAVERHGRDPSSLQFGAYVNVVCSDDVTAARDLARAGTGLFARFSVMHGDVSGPADSHQLQVFHDIHDRYDMNQHGRPGGQQTTALTDEFMDAFSILGPANYCVERLAAIADLGIDKLAVTGPNFDSGTPNTVEAASRFIDEVAPAIR